MLGETSSRPLQIRIWRGAVTGLWWVAAFGWKLQIINIAGAEANDDENLQLREEIGSGAQILYVYLFDIARYFASGGYKQQVELDLQDAREQCKDKRWTLKAIGSHLDECRASAVEVDGRESFVECVASGRLFGFVEHGVRDDAGRRRWI